MPWPPPGADTSQIERFVDLVKANISMDIALRMVNAPQAIEMFVKATIDTAKNGTILDVLGLFLYGREDAIPEMFSTLLRDWSVPALQTPTFVYYLKRHIELDGDSHGPAAAKLVHDATQGSESKLRQIYRAGLNAVEQRIALWDALQSELAQLHELDDATA